MDIDQLVDSAALAAQFEAGLSPAALAADPRLRIVGAAAAHRHNPPWTEREDEFVRAHLGTLSLAEIGARLGRSANAVKIHYQRALRLAPPTKQAHILTANQVASGLGIDSHAIIRLLDRGFIPSRELPFQFGGRKTRPVRVVDRVSLLRWATDPRSWIYFDPDRVARAPIARGAGKFDRPFWEKLRALVLRRRSLWDDEWWRAGQVAAYHGVDHRDVNRAIHEGRLPAVDWGNWWVLRSDATRPGFRVIAWRGRSGKGLDHKPVSPRADAFTVLASAVGFSAPAIDCMMNLVKRIDHRLKVLRGRGRLPWIVKHHQLPVRFNRQGEMLADWKEHRRRFKRLARAMDRFRAGHELREPELQLVRGVLKAWLRYYARSQDQRDMVRALHGLGRRKTHHLRDMYRQMRRWGIDPYRRLGRR